MLKFDNLNVNFNENTVLKDFSLELKQGEIIALVGESGSGKTTAVRAAMGLLPSDGYISSGDILLDGTSLVSMNEKTLNSMRGTKLSMIFQDCGSMLNPVCSIGSQFVEFIRAHEKISKKDARIKAKNALEKLNLPHSDIIMKAIPSDLSGGMRQRVGIAMAMTFTPQILFADEPTSALDVTIQAQIISQMAKLREEYNTSIVLVTHNLAVARYLADKIFVMNNGIIVEQGFSDDIIKNPSHEYTKQLIQAIPDFRRKSYV